MLRLRTDRLQWLETDGEVIALDEQAFVYLNANPTGSLLWRTLAEGTARGSVFERTPGSTTSRLRTRPARTRSSFGYALEFLIQQVTQRTRPTTTGAS